MAALTLRYQRRRAAVLDSCAGLVALDGNRRHLVRKMRHLIRRADRSISDWRRGKTSAEELSAALLDLSARVDNATVWHDGVRHRTYDDVSLQTKVLRILVEQGSSRLSVPPAEVAGLVARHVPDSRPALVVHGELLLESGDSDGALAAARSALDVQAICTTAEALLMRTYRRRREEGHDDHESAVVDYELKDKFCPVPFTHLSVGWEGNGFVCACPSWVPYPVGSVYEAETPDALWNSDVAREVRRSILDGEFTYCSRTQCSLIQAQNLPRKDDVDDAILRRYIDEHETRVSEAPKLVELDHDPTCNLACPSCRTGIVASSPADRERFERAAERILLPMLREVDGWVYIAGGGEALSSPHMRSLLRRLNRDEFPDLSVYLITNGLLFTPRRWATLPTLPEMVGIVAVSVDAARPETYERLRYPGKWEVLRANLDHIAALRRAGEIPLFQLNFVVQGGNFREILEFVELGKELGVDSLWFQRLVNYGSYDAETFAGLDVSSPRHPDHPELLEILRHPALDSPSIEKGMLLGLLPEVVASDEPMRMTFV
jgi:pyruvate-formate lyase-activating enzyme